MEDNASVPLSRKERKKLRKNQEATKDPNDAMPKGDEQHEPEVFTKSMPLEFLVNVFSSRLTW